MNKKVLLITPILLLGVLAGCKKTTKYEVTIDFNYEGSTPYIVSVNENAKLEMPTSPTRIGWTFENWYTEPECENLYNFESPVTNNFTIYANWIIKSVDFDLSETNVSMDKGDEKELSITLGAQVDPSDIDIVWTIKDTTHIKEVSKSEGGLKYKFKGIEVGEPGANPSIEVVVKTKDGGIQNKKSCSVTVRSPFDGRVSKDEWNNAIDTIFNYSETRNFTATMSDVTSGSTYVTLVVADGKVKETALYGNDENDYCFETVLNESYVHIGKRDDSYCAYKITDNENSIVSLDLSYVKLYAKDKFENYEYVKDESSGMYYYQLKAGQNNNQLSVVITFNKDRRLQTCKVDAGQYRNVGDGFLYAFKDYGDSKITDFPNVANIRELSQIEGQQKLTTMNVLMRDATDPNSIIPAYTCLDLSLVKDLDYTKDINITLLDEEGAVTTDIYKISYMIDGNASKELTTSEGVITLNASMLSEAKCLNILAFTKKADAGDNYKICVEYNVPIPPDHIKYCTYTLSGNEVSVKAKTLSAGQTFPESLTIPEKIDGKYCGGEEGTEYTITSIPSMGFQYVSNLKTLVLPSTIKEIGSGAFYGCYGLNSINLQNTQITDVKTNLFNSCSQLKSVTLPSTVKAIGGYAFSGCSLESFVIPTGVESIGSASFGMVSVPSSVTFESIDDWTIFPSDNMSCEYFIPSSDGKENSKTFTDKYQCEFRKNVKSSLIAETGTTFKGSCDGTKKLMTYQFTGSYTSEFSSIKTITFKDQDGNKIEEKSGSGIAAKKYILGVALTINGTAYSMSYDQTNKCYSIADLSEAKEGPIVVIITTAYNCTATKIAVEIE